MPFPPTVYTPPARVDGEIIDDSHMNGVQTGVTETQTELQRHKTADHAFLPLTGGNISGALSVQALPLVVSPDAQNALEWRPNGLYSGGAFGNVTVVQRQEFSPAAAATTVTLSAAPTEILSVTRNGVEQSLLLGHYTVAGAVLTVADAFAAGEHLAVLYEVGAGLAVPPSETDFYTKTQSDGRYVNAAGDTMSDLLALQLPGSPIGRLFQRPGRQEIGLTVNLKLNAALTDWERDNPALPGVVTHAIMDSGVAWGVSIQDAAGTWTTRPWYVNLAGDTLIRDKPLAASPDSGNGLQWRANGLYAVAGAPGVGFPARAWDTDGVPGTNAELRQVTLAGASHKDWALTFDGTVAEYADCSFAVPPSYEGIPIVAHVTWRTTAIAGNAVFRVDGLVTAAGGDPTAAMSTLFAAAAFPCQATASRLQVSALPWTAAVPLKNNHLQLRFWRRGEDAADTINAVDVDVLNVTFAFG